MAGKFSNLGASSSSSSKKTAAKQQEEKRKQCATTSRADGAKKQRPFHLTNFTARPSGTAVVPFRLHGARSSRSTALPFPMDGVNGAAPRWSTAATLDRAASRAAAALPPPVTAGANGPAAAPAPGLQPPGAAAASAASNAAGAAALALPPLVVAQVGAGGQLVPMPLHFIGYHPTGPGLVVAGLPAPVVGIPLAAALDKIENITLGRMLTALMPVCHPPLWHHQNRKSGTPPPWWPTGSEDWWGPELLAHSHLDTVAALTLAPTATPVPFAPSYSLKKAQKVAVLVAIVKHLAPDFARIAAAVSHSGKLSVSETDLWHSALNYERAKCMRPVFLLLQLPQQQQQSGGGGTGAENAGSVVVHSGGNAASDGWKQQVAIANLPAAAGASVSAPADGSRSRSRGEVIAAAELLVEKERRSDVDGVVVVPAADAPAGGGRDQPVVSFPAGDDGSTHKQGAAVAAAPTGHAREVAAEPEMTMQQPEQHGGGVAGSDDVAAAAEDDQVQVHPVVDVEEEEGHHWWLDEEELDRVLAAFESFGDVGY